MSNRRNVEFNVESLECRKMLAGDVSVEVTGGGDLRIRGDNLDNNISIENSFFSSGLIITGIDGTTVNGQESVIISGVTDDFVINMRGGDDTVQIRSEPTSRFMAVPDDVNFRSGSGNDILTMDRVLVGDDVRVNTGSGADVAILHKTTAEDVRANMGADKDVFEIVFSNIHDDVVVNGGSGGDGFGIRDTNADVVKMVGGAGDDIFLDGYLPGVSSDLIASFNISGGGGSDSLVYFNEFGEPAVDFASSIETTEVWQFFGGNDYRDFEGYLEASSMIDFI